MEPRAPHERLTPERLLAVSVLAFVTALGAILAVAEGAPIAMVVVAPLVVGAVALLTALVWR